MANVASKHLSAVAGIHVGGPRIDILLELS